MAQSVTRCVNLDWVEVYVLESRLRYPCNAQYFRDRGYFVRERDYGTRTYSEMFTIEDEHGEPWIEIRRNPQSGDASFSGLVPESCHIRLTNRACYFDTAISQLREFLLLHDYIYKRIYRLDVCYDFIRFDTGDDPQKFARRYLAKRYSKINQCKVSAHGNDGWSTFEWESLSWGARKSMVSTKMYCKTKELAANKTDKPYIKYSWYLAGLIDNPTTMEKRNSDGTIVKPDIWRIEFSLKSSLENWILIEDQSGKHQKKSKLRHTLDMFDSRDKLWQRFQDLAYHYFRFKVYEEGVRKDRCKDKTLFRWDAGREFYSAQSLPRDAKPVRDDEILRKKLQHYREMHADLELRKACDVVLHALSEAEFRRVTPRMAFKEAEVLRKTIALKMGYPMEDAAVIMQRVQELIFNDEIW